MDSSSEQCTNWCASKVLKSANITAHSVPSVARSSVTVVESFRPSQNQDLRGVVAGLVSGVNFKVLHLKIVLPFLNASRQMKIMHAHKNQTVIWKISNAPGEQRGSGSQLRVSEITHRGNGVNSLWCWVPCNKYSCLKKLWLRLRYFF